jgi:predicted AlkP superfamily pyrophosphatase or phosphodiesterase
MFARLRAILRAAVLAAAFCAVHALAAAAPAPATKPPLILISIDGFRADYIARGRTPVLARLAREGVWAAQGMRPSFPSVTFPNHYTLVTGRVPDHHGIVANTMEDPAIQPDSHFSLHDYAAVSDPRWWAQATPIWVSAERQHLRAGTMFWPGSEAPIDGVRPELWAHFDGAVTADQRVDIVLDWMDAAPDKRPAFVTLYFNAVDSQGHAHGPDSPEVDAALAETDAAVGRLIEGLQRRGLAANLVIVADHGMAAVSPDRVVYLDDATDMAGAELIDSGAVAGVKPASAAQAAALVGRHGHATCWLKADIPARLRYGTNPRVPPLVCLADVGWLVTTRAEAAAHAGHALAGEHGYDPASPRMAALFIAHGPAFRRGLEVAPFDNVDVYPLLTDVLGIAPEPNDGDAAQAAAMLAGR